jgi:GNAT superfamily N-acetyltransferase
MQSDLIVNWFPEIAQPPGGQTMHPRDKGHPRLPSLRPIWGLLPNRCGYDIRPARTPYQHGLANMLVRRMYSWRGYNAASDGNRLDDPNRVILTAWQYEEVVATLTLGRDSPAGLLADALYAHELAGLRRPDRVVCEVSRLAVDPDFSSHDLLNALFQAALKYARDIFTASDAVIEVNPRHARYYQRRLGFRQIGNQRQCQRVNAPAVFMHQQLDDLALPVLGRV